MFLFKISKSSIQNCKFLCKASTYILYLQPGTSTSVASYQHVQSVLLPPLYTLPPASPDVLEASEEIIRDTSEENVSLVNI